MVDLRSKAHVVRRRGAATTPGAASDAGVRACVRACVRADACVRARAAGQRVRVVRIGGRALTSARAGRVARCAGAYFVARLPNNTPPPLSRALRSRLAARHLEFGPSSRRDGPSADGDACPAAPTLLPVHTCRRTQLERDAVSAQRGGSLLWDSGGGEGG